VPRIRLIGTGHGGLVISSHRKIFDALCRLIPRGTLTVTFSDGETTTYGSGEPALHLVLKHPGLVRKILANFEIAVLEGIIAGEIEVPTGIPSLVKFSAEAMDPPPAWFQKLQEVAGGLKRRRIPLLKRNRADVQRHYDLGNDFFALWLDPTMTYSCGYFRTPEDTLEMAQRQKVRHVLNKVRPKTGETLLDIGCGWGSVISEAAGRFGMDALGITLSEEQVAWFNERAVAGTPKVGGKCESRLLHYHELVNQGRTFDKIVSVGMLEHVGKQHIGTFAKDLKALLKPGGLALIHCITFTSEAPVSPWILKHIFPGGYIPTVSELVRHFSDQLLVILDVENLGQHYALTLDRWLANFEAHVPEVEARYGPEFVKIWRMYLTISAEGFRYEDMYVHQFLLCNGRPMAFPLTRDNLYTGAGGAV